MYGPWQNPTVTSNVSCRSSLTSHTEFSVRTTFVRRRMWNDDVVEKLNSDVSLHKVVGFFLFQSSRSCTHRSFLFSVSYGSCCRHSRTFRWLVCPLCRGSFLNLGFLVELDYLTGTSFDMTLRWPSPFLIVIHVSFRLTFCSSRIGVTGVILGFSFFLLF